MSNIAVKVENLSKAYQLGEIGTGTISRDVERWWAKIRGKEDPFLKIGETNDRTKKGTSDMVWSLKDINFEIEKGTSVGIIGKNGAGKSTLLKILSRITSPTTGNVMLNGRVASLLEVGTGFHPELSGKDNIYLNGSILGMRKAEITKKLDEIIDFAGIERYIDTPVKRYSSGMYVRLAFAVAAHLESEILIVDEVLAVGDAEFQKKCLGKMNDVSKKDGRTVLFVSHNMEAVRQLCNTSVILRNGVLFDFGVTEKIIDNYLSTNSKLCLSKKWNGIDNPINDFIKVNEVKVSYEDDSVPEFGNFSITKNIILKVEYEITKTGTSFIYGANFYNNQDINIFDSHDVTSEDRNSIKPIGTYESTMLIPGNLLSEGLLSISIALFTPSPLEIFIYLNKIITINIVDEMDGTSARGFFSQSFPGYIRPKLNWTNKLLNYD
jgi:lipopolysaccharide transport system ATP-binding protein